MNELEDKLKAAVLAAALTGREDKISGKKETGKALKWVIPAVAAAVAAALVLIPGRPKDTFDDPVLAYAEVEKAFAYMSEKIETGSEIASKAEESVELIKTVFK